MFSYIKVGLAGFCSRDTGLQLRSCESEILVFSFHIPTSNQYAYANGSNIYYYENYF